jgi:hypothetical protein
MGYFAGTVIAVVGGLIILAVAYVQHELRPDSRPLPVFARKKRRVRRVAPGDSCVCGGTIGKTGRTSARFGELLGCTGCKRSWTMDGRRIIRRRPGSPRQAQRPAA